MARRSGPVSLVVASILVLAIPVVMMSVSPHRTRGATNVQIQFAAGGQQAPATTSQGSTASTTGGAAHPATARHGGGPGRQGGSAGGGSGIQGNSGGMAATASDTYLRRPARAPVEGGGDTSLIGEPNPPVPLPVPVPTATGLPNPLPSVPSVHLHFVPKPHKFVLAKWIARCDVSGPGKPGTMAFDVYYQQHPSGAYGFPVDAMQYPCGSDWAIIPGADPFTPPVWIGKTAPFVPATNMPGGQIFTAVEVPASQVAAQLAAAGVPVGSAGQLITYGSDGVPV